MGRNSQITYKLIQNERLKPVLFHGKEMFPLYLRVTYNRIPTLLKSYYFDLLKSSKYELAIAGKHKSSPLNQVMEAEKKAIEFVINKVGSDYDLSLDLFKKEYDRHSRDIISLMEEDFRGYLITFFNDEGYPAIAKMIANAGSSQKSEDLLYDLKSVLKPFLNTKLLNNAVHYAPPYIPIVAFVRTLRDNPLGILPVFAWLNEEIKASFTQFIKQQLPSYDEKSINAYISQIIG